MHSRRYNIVWMDFLKKKKKKNCMDGDLNRKVDIFSYLYFSLYCFVFSFLFYNNVIDTVISASNL